MAKKYDIESIEDCPGMIQLLEDKLYEHNSKRLNREDGRLFSAIVRGGNNDTIAGVAGWTWAGACEITQLWVDESVRNNGIGKMLLQAAETEAASRRCDTIMVRTHGFQAPGFYMKHGYSIRGLIEDFPPGHHYYILTKQLI